MTEQKISRLELMRLRAEAAVAARNGVSREAALAAAEAVAGRKLPRKVVSDLSWAWWGGRRRAEWLAQQATQQAAQHEVRPKP